MSESSSSSESSSPRNDNTPPHLLATGPTSYATPGWFISGIFHAGLLAMLTTTSLHSCRYGLVEMGGGRGDSVEVGFYASDSTLVSSSGDGEESGPSEGADFTTPSTPTVPASQPADPVANDLISLPDVPKRAIIGESQGAPTATGNANNSDPIFNDAMVTSNSVRAPAGGQGNGRGTGSGNGTGRGRVSFMGQSAMAQSVVFVIDTSSSMLTNDAIDYAKAKLLQSINGLDQSQQFQIVSYTLVPTVMRLRADQSASAPLYRATGANLTLAKQWVNSLVATGGTKHRPALQEAFRFKPDVIFFLTDADSDGLSPREIWEIKTLWNKLANTQIHCIKFGKGADLQPVEANFMRKLASDSRGSYSYLDIEQLGTP